MAILVPKEYVAPTGYSKDADGRVEINCGQELESKDLDAVGPSEFVKCRNSLSRPYIKNGDNWELVFRNLTSGRDVLVAKGQGQARAGKMCSVEICTRLEPDVDEPPAPVVVEP